MFLVNLALRTTMRPPAFVLTRRAIAIAAMLCWPAHDVAADSAAAEESSADRLSLLGGGDAQGLIRSISADGKVVVAGHNKPFSLQDMRRIRRDVKVQPRTDAKAIVHLVGGGRLLVDTFVVTDEQCVIDWAFGRGIKLPIEAVRGIQFDPANKIQAGAARLARSLKETKSEDDQLFVKVSGGVQSVPGLLEKLGAESIVFNLKGKSKTFLREKIYGVVLAGLGAAEATGPCRITLRDGSLLSGAIHSLADGRLTVTPTAGASLTVPWKDVSEVVIRSDRILYLSEIEPQKVKQYSVVTRKRKWRKDLSVDGRPLTVGKTVFERGLGVHAYCNLTFARPDKYTTFAATLGIDEESRGKGDCLFVVLGDGKELLRERVRTGDRPKQVQVRIAGVKLLQLIVEPGEDLDLGDHADWCAARLIKDRQPVTKP
jgi:hypothetical protein